MRKAIILIACCAMLLTSCRVVESDLSSDSTAPDETVVDAVTTNVSTDSDKETDTEPVTDHNETADVPDGAVITGIKLDKYEVKIEVGLTDMPWVTMLPETASEDVKKEKWESSDTSIATVNHYGKITGVKAGTCTVTVTSVNNPTVKAEVNVTVVGATQLTYIDGMLIVNKTYKLPSNYAPGVDPTANSALNAMIAGAKKDGINLFLKSGYRSYGTQSTLYNNYVARDGVAEADRYSARPGHSEHQTGLAFDLNSLEQSFGETAEGKWLAAHCHEYGFIIRYPQGKEGVTGYMYEPWHVRYLGVEKATAVHNSGLCLEEYLGITSEYGY